MFRRVVPTVPEWELRALEYIVGAVLLGLVFVVTTSSKPLCPLDNPWSLAYNDPKQSGFIIQGMESLYPPECGWHGNWKSP